MWITFRDLKQSTLGAVGLADKVLFEKLCVALVRTSVLWVQMSVLWVRMSVLFVCERL